MDGTVAFFTVVTAPQSLSVNRYNFCVKLFANPDSPLGKSFREFSWIEHREDPPKRIMAGDSATQLEKRLQPLLLGVSEAFEVYKAFGPTQHCADRDH